MQRNKLNAYLIGAGVGGTLVVIPHIIVRPILTSFYPGTSEIYQPYFLLPIIWGLWNLLYASFNRTPSIGVWGAILGFILGLSVCFLIYAGGYWFWAGILIPVFVPAVYFILWDLIIGTLNHTLGIE